MKETPQQSHSRMVGRLVKGAYALGQSDALQGIYDRDREDVIRIVEAVSGVHQGGSWDADILDAYNTGLGL